jgi:hypothetical protein
VAQCDVLDIVFEEIIALMLRNLLLLALCVLISVSASSAATPAAAQDLIQGWTQYALTVYSDADRSSAIVGVLVPRAKVILEGRSTTSTWVLGRTTDGRVRGWMESRYLNLNDAARTLPISGETMFVIGEILSTGDYTGLNLNDFPIIPISLGRAREIFERGQKMGADLHAISKIGDCISDNQYFLSPFGWGQYNLGNYIQLQSVIDHFETGLAADSLAAYDGLVTTAVLDPLFANPMACLPGETPLRCEYRVHNSSVAVIMFGAQDLLFTTADDFDRNLRRIIHETIQVGVIPILSTFPGNLQKWNSAILYNQIVVQVALDYNIPLMNLWLALDALPNHGLSGDGRHLSPPITTSGDLTPSNLQRGYPLRNLVTLETLDFVWRNAMY